jgi:hypothetical protein
MKSLTDGWRILAIWMPIALSCCTVYPPGNTHSSGPDIYSASGNQPMSADECTQPRPPGPIATLFPALQVFDGPSTQQIAACNAQRQAAITQEREQVAEENQQQAQSAAENDAAQKTADLAEKRLLLTPLPSFPPGAFFPPRDPSTAGVVGVYAQEISIEMMICGLRSQHYSDVMSQAAMQLYFQLPDPQKALADQLINSGGKIPDPRAMGLLSCQGYMADNKYTALINSMDDFVARVNNQ